MTHGHTHHIHTWHGHTHHIRTWHLRNCAYEIARRVTLMNLYFEVNTKRRYSMADIHTHVVLTNIRQAFTS